MSTRIIRRFVSHRLPFTLALALIGACVQPSTSDDASGTPIGALLPFTGDLAANGSSVERALLFALEQGDAAGAQELRLAARDTHSDWRRGMDSARALFDEEAPYALIGPEEDELAKQLVPLIKARQVLVVSGGASSPRLRTADDGDFFFRTAPSASIYGRALAERMATDGVERAGVLTVEDEYGSGFANVLIQELLAVGIAVGTPVSFSVEASSHADALQTVLADAPDAVVLVAYAQSGASVIQEWAALGGRSRWYFTPALESPDFLDNVPPGTLNGMVGVSLAPPASAAAFASAFGERFAGEHAGSAVLQNYDAMALVLLATAAARGTSASMPSAAAVRDQLIAVSGPPGTVVTWDTLPEGIARAAAGEDVNYEGVSGPVDLDGRGDVTGAAVGYWSIEGDRIVTIQ